MLKPIVLGAIAVWNLIVFILYAADKRRAEKGAWRIPEKTLIGSALLCGGIGALLGMQLLRHKTKHIQFKISVPIGALITAAAIAAVIILL